MAQEHKEPRDTTLPSQNVSGENGQKPQTDLSEDHAEQSSPQEAKATAVTTDFKPEAHAEQSSPQEAKATAVTTDFKSETHAEQSSSQEAKATAVATDFKSEAHAEQSSSQEAKAIGGTTDSKREEESRPDYDESKKAEAVFVNLLARRSAVLSIGIPYLIFGLVLLAGYEYRLYSFIFQASQLSIQSPVVRVLALWLLAIAIAGTFFYFSVQSRINRAKVHWKRIDEGLELKRLSTTIGRLSYYREKLSRLTAKTAKVFFFDTERYEKAECLRGKAVQALDSVTDNLTAAGLSNVETNLTALEEIINREEQEQKEQRYWQYAALVVMCLYIAGLITCVVILKAANSSTLTPIFNVPLAVVVWGAAGSLGAILYRFYTETGRIRFASEFRWLIARPIIGIIMGAVVYLAIMSGLVLLGATGATPPQGSGGSFQAGRIEVYSVIAFLAGFSDKFYLGVIDLLVATTVRSEEVKPNVFITEKQRVPEIHRTDDSDDEQKHG